MRIAHLYRFDNRSAAQRAEGLAHGLFERKRQRGEWFRVDVPRVVRSLTGVLVSEFEYKNGVFSTRQYRNPVERELSRVLAALAQETQIPIFEENPSYLQTPMDQEIRLARIACLQAKLKRCGAQLMHYWERKFTARVLLMSSKEELEISIGLNSTLKKLKHQIITEIERIAQKDLTQLYFMPAHWSPWTATGNLEDDLQRVTPQYWRLPLFDLSTNRRLNNGPDYDTVAAMASLWGRVETAEELEQLWRERNPAPQGRLADDTVFRLAEWAGVDAKVEHARCDFPAT